MHTWLTGPKIINVVGFSRGIYTIALADGTEIKRSKKEAAIFDTFDQMKDHMIDKARLAHELAVINANSKAKAFNEAQILTIDDVTELEI